jgi:hypothetical protein
MKYKASKKARLTPGFFAYENSLAVDSVREFSEGIRAPSYSA